MHSAGREGVSACHAHRFNQPIRRATPAARIMAKIISTGFQEGDRVEAARVLIRLDIRDLLARKRRPEPTSIPPPLPLMLALNLERMRNLQKSGTVSHHQLETTEVVHAQANAAATAAKSGLDEIDVNLSYAVARAPFSGVIVRKMVEVGNMVAPGQGLFIIEDDSRLRIIAPVGTDLAEGLKPGQTLHVRMGEEKVQGNNRGDYPLRQHRSSQVCVSSLSSTTHSTGLRQERLRLWKYPLKRPRS